MYQLLAHQQRDTLLQLEAAREAEARTARHWQVGGECFLYDWWVCWWS
jgi:hypothetical protein